MRPSIRLSRVHRWSLYLVWLVLGISGLYFAYSQDWQMQEPSDLTVNALKIHGIFAAVMLLFIGSLFSMHIKMSLHRKRNLWSGLSLLSIMLILAATGTALYYSPESWHDNSKWLHIWVGVVSVLALPLHIVVGRWLRHHKKALS